MSGGAAGGPSTWPHPDAVRNAAVDQHRVPLRATAPGGSAPSPSRGAAASRLCFALAPSTRLTGPHLATGCRISPSSPSSSPCSSCWEMPFPHRVVATLVSPVPHVPNQGMGGLRAHPRGALEAASLQMSPRCCRLHGKQRQKAKRKKKKKRRGKCSSADNAASPTLASAVASFAVPLLGEVCCSPETPGCSGQQGPS